MDSAKFRKTKGEQSLVYLPEEIIEEILPILPVKSLLRFKCVSKSWHSLIDSKKFINKHVQNSQRRVIFNNYLVHGLKKQWSIDVDPWWPIDDPTNNHLKTGSRIVGCCNGVLCILKHGRVFLWNPATRMSMELPRIKLFNKVHGKSTRACGFGWDEESDAYKVFVCVSNRHNQSICKVFSSKTNSWKIVEGGRISIDDDVGVFTCGKIHWIPKSGHNYIESFDLKSEVFGMIELPLEPEDGVGRWLRERDGCLYVLYNNNDNDDSKGSRGSEAAELLDVWVMGEYGVKESWVKISTLPTPSDYGLSTTNFVCNRDDNDENITPFYQQYFYVESLVSPVGTYRLGKKL